MSTSNGLAYRLYDSFRRDLRKAEDIAGVMRAFGQLMPTLQAAGAAVLVQGLGGRKRSMRLAADVGQLAIWSDYLALCRSNKEPLSRILRLSPHPVALSDVCRHPRLAARTGPISELLAVHGMNDAFAVPFFNQTGSFDETGGFASLIVVGRDLTLRPTNRYLITQVAADTILRIAHVRAATTAQHHKLTPRQLEIAEWLVKGKTDWEIGEILRISPKTVNFHVENIKRTYGVRSRNQFVAAIVHDGGLPPA